MPYIGNPSAQRFTSPRAASVFSGDGSTVAFTLEEAVSTDEDILVSVDGVIQEPSVAYAVSSGTTLTFTAAPSSNSGNNIFVYYIARTLGSVSMPDGQNVNAAVGTFTGAFTSLGIDDNADATAITIDSSENVGIGVSDPGDYDSRAERLVVGEDADTGITIAGGSSSDCRLVFAVIDQTDLSNGSIGYDQSADTMTFETAGSERMRILSGGGITFNGDTATANALDDYEEGTFTLEFQNSGLSGTVNVGTTAHNTYIKIGRSVFLAGYVQMSGDSTSGSAISLTGLPFNTDTYTAVAGSLLTAYGGGDFGLSCYINSNTLQLYASNVAYNQSYNSISYNETGPIRFHFTIHYYTS